MRRLRARRSGPWGVRTAAGLCAAVARVLHVACA